MSVWDESQRSGLVILTTGVQKKEEKSRSLFLISKPSKHSPAILIIFHSMALYGKKEK